MYLQKATELYEQVGIEKFQCRHKAPFWHNHTAEVSVARLAVQTE
jgi:hypothetical protein